MAALNANLPTPTAPVVDPATGLVTQAWWYFFQRLFARTGAGSGSNFGPPTPITVGASPFQFTAPSNGFVLIAGGGISRLLLGVGQAKYATGAFYGAFPVLGSSTLEVTYVRAPVMTFVPG